jgi:hypothetical protein
MTDNPDRIVWDPFWSSMTPDEHQDAMAAWEKNADHPMIRLCNALMEGMVGSVSDPTIDLDLSTRTLTASWSDIDFSGHVVTVNGRETCVSTEPPTDADVAWLREVADDA